MYTITLEHKILSALLYYFLQNRIRKVGIGYYFSLMIEHNFFMSSCELGLREREQGKFFQVSYSFHYFVVVLLQRQVVVPYRRTSRALASSLGQKTANNPTLLVTRLLAFFRL